jgi:hypothetical protein
MSPGWLMRIETLGTTLVVLMIGAMMVWYEAVQRERRLVVTIACAVVLYVAVLVMTARRSGGGIPWWPFAAAGVVTGAAAELINARFLVTLELLTAVVTGLVIGTAHWAAVRVWIGLGARRRNNL